MGHGADRTRGRDERTDRGAVMQTRSGRAASRGRVGDDARKVLGVAALTAALTAACSGSATVSSATAPASPTRPTATTTSPAPVTTPRTPVPRTPVPSTGAPTATPQAGTSRCALAQLELALGRPGAAAGSTYTPITFRNTGSVPCSLDGYPGVSFVAGDRGQQVGAAATRTGTAQPVLLAPGDTAHATLQESNAGNHDPAACRPTAVPGLRVYPPGETASAFLVDGTTACADPGVQQLRIGPVQPGASGP